MGGRSPKSCGLAVGAALLLLTALCPVAVPAFAASSLSSSPWPNSSDLPVAPLPHPTLEEYLTLLGDTLNGGFRLVVYGDQRPLARNEWPAMTRIIARREQTGALPTPLAAVLDTGDFLNDGTHTDQFHMFTEIVEPLRTWPYLIAIGNHELDSNRTPLARHHVIELLGGPLGLSPDCLHYRRDIGPLRALFLDSCTFVYGTGHELSGPSFETPAARGQLQWLRDQLDEPHDGPTVVILHHPFLMSSRMHEKDSARLWSLRHEGSTLAELFASHGVDLVLAGHSHTYERFRVSHGDGAFDLVNVSGRPKDAPLRGGASARRARDIQGRELRDLSDRGWQDLEGWTITQVDAMTAVEANQWLELRVGPDGALEAEVFYLVDGGRQGYRSGGAFTLRR